MAKYEFPAHKMFIRPVDMRKRYGPGYDPNVFGRWEKSGKAVKLRNGVYLNNAFPLGGQLDRFIVSRNLYEPSYVSLHSALRYYNVIPEAVYETTAVSTLKTKSFETPAGRYSYQTLGANKFWGYQLHAWHGGYYQIADLEKSLLDLAYLEPLFADPDWIRGMRFDPEELMMGLDINKLIFYERVMDVSYLHDRMQLLLKTCGL